MAQGLPATVTYPSALDFVARNILIARQQRESGRSSATPHGSHVAADDQVSGLADQAVKPDGVVEDGDGVNAEGVADPGCHDDPGVVD
ncbi:MAG TPA: hypothetical protein VHT75_20365 [Acidimicrobiales bacterium]|nr:hypothetical protein [Acidimicrobiales bacterium]